MNTVHSCVQYLTDPCKKNSIKLNKLNLVLHFKTMNHDLNYKSIQAGLYFHGQCYSSSPINFLHWRKKTTGRQTVDIPAKQAFCKIRPWVKPSVFST